MTGKNAWGGLRKLSKADHLSLGLTRSLHVSGRNWNDLLACFALPQTGHAEGMLSRIGGHFSYLFKVISRGQSRMKPKVVTVSMHFAIAIGAVKVKL